MANPTDAPNVLSIQILGKFELRLDGQPVELHGRKARALLGYLVLNESCEETRERLVGLLWSDSDGERARGSLRQCLREIRAALPSNTFDGFVADRLEIALDRDKLDVDLWNVLDEVIQGRAPARLLDGPDLLDEMLMELQTVDEQFGFWLTAKRLAIKERILRLLETPLRALVQEKEDVTRIARVILNLDPTHEEATRQLMHTLAARGDAAGAQRAYRKLWDVLAVEFDSEPDQKTQDVIAEIKAALPFSGGAPHGGALDVAPPGDPQGPQEAIPPVDQLLARSSVPRLPQTTRRQAVASLTVGPAAERPFAQDAMQLPLPLVPPTGVAPEGRWGRHEGARLVLSIAPFGLSGSEDSLAYILQGFRRELIACLVRFREWVVREQFSGPMAPEANTEEYVLEASGLCTAMGIRLALTLKDATTNDYLWSEILDLNLESLFHAQLAVVRRVTTALNVHVSANRMAQIAPRPDENLRAYDLWLRGQAFFLTYEPLGWQKASEIFREIIVRNPSFSPAYSSLAQLQNTIHFVHPGVERTNERTEEALSYARSAARLDPIDSRAQLCLGWAHAMSGQHDQAATHHKLAHELNGNDPWTLVSSALGFAFRGDADRARALADHALLLSMTPSPAQWRYQAMIRYMNGDYEACLAAALQAESSIANVLVWKGAALHHLGRKNDARHATEAFFNSVAARWFNNHAATRETMTRWFLQAFPIAKPDDWRRLRDDFSGAGAPVHGITYQAW